MSQIIEIVEYDPRWKKEYKERAKEVKKLLGKNCVATHHIGSTAIKNLASRSIIDIMIIVRSFDVLMQKKEALLSLGYRLAEDGENKKIFVKGEKRLTHVIHVWEWANAEEFGRPIALRSYLSNYPKGVSDYSELKKKLAKESPSDILAYQKGKKELLDRFEKEALVWQKQQDRQATGMTIGMCLGLAVGMSVGGALGSVSAGMCMGMGVGMSLGLAIGSIKRRS